MEKLLVIDDDLGIQKQLKWGLTDYETVFAQDRQSAIAQLRLHEPKVVTLDLGLPPDASNATEGLAILEQILSLLPDTKVIVVTGNSDQESALKAIALGAYDYYLKPIELPTISVILERAFYLVNLERELTALEQRHSQDSDIIGSSEAILKARQIVDKVADTEISVLLLGQSGTGKEVFARTLHKKSARAEGPFIAINCASIPENLLESELFGYEKGAFTGAVKTTAGKIEHADGGTLFLDEIGDMPLPLQAKMLRFLQERTIERVGGRKEIPVDIRVVCATHRDIPEMVANEAFREDLYYRLSEITLKIPPLKDRDKDTLLLAKHFLNSYSRQLNKPCRGLADDAKQALLEYAWPGNIRELQNKIKSAVVMADKPFIGADDLMLNLSGGGGPAEVFNLRQVRETAESNAIRRAFVQADSNLSRTAELLGITRPTLYALIDKYGLSDIKSNNQVN
ncbi:Nitrogen assimilation regulatory protein [Saliniradius amylolyticus]|uniref:Nitrogen assimilation regulatory protein n=1 Tax=Saliniradius amylolyticus TaxID=2183582 RepID=A0A2S2E210_9ALTE|nr:PEP-CTERM-box response regulator transcription factor [Saliniradius amylolyticus]AWL11674.1 Nitrogen assimilation regulatory protein [Saliniradius amylolyticus]